jgi:DHA1 family bicyclomycin/chloramphenicol resistance-like MFS transporter
MTTEKSRYESAAFIILLGSLTAFDPLSIDMYLPAFPEIGKYFNVQASSVELSLSAFFIGLALGQLLYGPLADIYGRKKPLLLGTFIYSLASFGVLFSTNIHMFIVFRILQALGGCAGMVITRAIVSDLFDKKRAAHIYSQLMLVMGVAPILAPMLGGFLTKFFGWKSIFITLGSLSLVSAFVTSVYLPETHKPTLERKPRPNLLGVYKKTLSDYAYLLREKSFMSYSLSGGLMRAAMFAYIAGSPFVFITFFDVPADKYALIFGANAVGIIGCSQINRVLLKRFPLEKIYRNVMFVSVALAAILLINSLYLPKLFFIMIPLFLLMASMGFIFPNSAALGMALQGPRAGMASALLGTLQWTIAFISSFFVSFFHNETAVPMTTVILMSTALATLCLALLKENHADASV